MLIHFLWRWNLDFRWKKFIHFDNVISWDSHFHQKDRNKLFFLQILKVWNIQNVWHFEVTTKKTLMTSTDVIEIFSNSVFSSFKSIFFCYDCMKAFHRPNINYLIHYSDSSEPLGKSYFWILTNIKVPKVFI